MRAAQFSEFGGPEKLGIVEAPDPTPKAGEIVIRVAAVGLNFFDTLVLRNRYQVTPTLPHSPGAEVAGTIEAVGPAVSGVEAGQRVMAHIGGNGCREKVVTEAKNAIPIPEGVSDEVAACLSVTYGTALHGFKDRGQLKPGETIAVLGAAGGAGLAAIEIAKLMGGRVIAVASSAEKLAIATAHGADEGAPLAKCLPDHRKVGQFQAVQGVNYQTEDLKIRLKEATGGTGVDVLYDCVGGPHAEPALRAMAWEGRYLVVGFAAGEIPRFPLNIVMLKGCSVVGVLLSGFVARHPDQHRANMVELLEWCRQGKIVPHIHGVFPLDETAKALGLIEGRKVTGKVIVNPQL
jgi:NADPH2:quinone reductase